MHTDPIADLFTRIKNASRARHEFVTVSYSKIKENIANIMAKNGFIEKAEVQEEKNFKELKITLKKDKNDISIKRISKPGQRIYVGKDEIKPVRHGLGISILSTSQGIMTGKEAKKLKIGGELICEIY